MLNPTARRMLAALQAVIGLEWLNSAVNKLALGTFPQGLADALIDGLKDNPNGWYVSFVQSFILPHSVFWGYVIEWSEVIAGLTLVGSALILLTQPRLRGEAQHRLAVGFSVAAIAGAAICIGLCVNFHFWMGKSVIVPNISPNGAYDEGIDLDGLLPMFAAIVIVSQWKLIAALRGAPLVAFHLPARSIATDGGLSIPQPIHEL